MFSPLNLFQNIPCPRHADCTRHPCFFSHRNDLPPPPPLCLPSPSPSSAKRPDPPTQSGSHDRPRKVQKVVASLYNPLPAPQQNSGVPNLRVVPAHSIVSVPVRQTMLKTLYDHFVVLYSEILLQNPTIAAEHSLKQEEEVYKKSTKQTYRNAMIQCVAAIKKRPTPNSLAHDSVGTEEEVIARVEARKRKSSELLHVTRAHLEPLVHSPADLEKAGYFVSVPDGPGGLQPSLDGKVMKCERCCQPFLVKHKNEADQCVFHWGRAFTATINGDKTRIYNCCSRPLSDPEGCTHGPHVFYESKAEELHSRYPFSFLKEPASASTALDVACIDCEMIYTTGGLQVARVSLIDGSGCQVFDQLVRMNDGVEVIDYNTRFSGITEEEHSKALLPLSSIRETLDSFINAETILIGHALENDLKTLRIIHLKCVDTSILFPHRIGLPYRRSLRGLVREHLGKDIQSGGGTVGHSSVEDAVATFDLVRWYLLKNNGSKSL